MSPNIDPPCKAVDPGESQSRTLRSLGWGLSAVGGWFVGLVIDSASGMETNFARPVIGAVIIVSLMFGVELRKLPPRAPIQLIAFRTCATTAAVVAVASILIPSSWTTWLVFTAASLTLIASLALTTESGSLEKLTQLGFAGVGISLIGYFQIIAAQDWERNLFAGICLFLGSVFMATALLVKSAVGQGLSTIAALLLSMWFIGIFLFQVVIYGYAAIPILTITAVISVAPCLAIFGAVLNRPLLPVAGWPLALTYIFAGLGGIGLDANPTGILVSAFGLALFLMCYGLAFGRRRLVIIGGLGCSIGLIVSGVLYMLLSISGDVEKPFKLLGTSLLVIGAANFGGLVKTITLSISLPDRVLSLLREPELDPRTVDAAADNVSRLPGEFPDTPSTTDA